MISAPLVFGAITGFIVGSASGFPFWLVDAAIGGMAGVWIATTVRNHDRQQALLSDRIDLLSNELTILRRAFAALTALRTVDANPEAGAAPTGANESIRSPVDAPPPQPATCTAEILAEVIPAARPPSSPTPSVAQQDDYPPQPIKIPDWLSRLWAGNPLVKIGVALLFFGIASGLRLAAEYGLLPIPVRLLLAAAAGLGLIGFGFAKARADKHRAFGLAVQGGGFGLLYLVAYFMLSRYAMIGQETAFALFAVLGVGCVALAARQDGPALAVLGISGAFLAPLLAGGHADTPLPLFSYFALLNAFILAVDWFRSWRVLNVTGFVFTLLLGMGWALDGYQPAHFLVTEAFLILFLVAYSGMPFLTSILRAPGLHGWRDGLLIFGTPLAGAFIQSRLMEGVAYGNAWSALAAAIWYAVLWALLFSRKNPDNTIVERSHLGIAIGFLTLSIPLAFGARVTSALWAAEGSAVLWYGLRTRRFLPQLTGLLMQLIAGAALMFGWTELNRTHPVANDLVLGGTLLAFAGLASARMLQAASDKALISAKLPFVWAMAWWLGIGLHEIHHFAPEARHAPFDLLFIMATVSAVEALATGWSWSQIRSTALLLLVAMWIAAASSFDHAGHPLPGSMALIMPAALVLHFGLLRRHEKHDMAALESIRHLGAYWLVLLLVPAEITWQFRHWTSATGLVFFIAWTLTMAGGIALVAFGTPRGIWPFARQPARYIPDGVLPPMLVLAGLLAWAALTLSGDGTGLPYLPILNPFDLTQIAGIAAMLSLLRAADARNAAGLRRLATVIGFLWFSSLAARMAHAWGGVPFAPNAMMQATLFQMLLTLLWTLASIGTMIAASRRANRAMWFGGITLLAVVGGKLLIFDAAGRGTLMWTGTLIGVAVLVLAASYFAPLPPSQPGPDQKTAP